MTGQYYRPGPTLLDRIALPVTVGIVALVSVVITAAVLGVWP